MVISISVLFSVAIMEKKVWKEPPTLSLTKPPTRNSVPLPDCPLLTRAPAWNVLADLTRTETYVTSSDSIIKPRLSNGLLVKFKLFPTTNWVLESKSSFPVTGFFIDISFGLVFDTKSVSEYPEPT